MKKVLITGGAGYIGSHTAKCLNAAGFEPVVFGNDYPTPDGTAVRDYIHVNDLADAHRLALRHLAGGGASGACNLGTGKGSSVMEVIRAVEAVTGRAVPIVQADRRAGDPPVLVASTARARRVLGWKPRLADIRTIVETAANWHASRVR